MRTPILALSAICGALSTALSVHAAQPLFATGLDTALSPHSVLYRIDDYTIQPRAVRIGDTGRILNDLAIDPSSQRFYGTDPKTFSLYELNPNNGTANLIGSNGLVFNGLAFDKGGQLWGWNCNGSCVGCLYR